MPEETIFQHWIFTKFILPFALIVAIIYALLEKTKILGEDKHQLNAIIAFVIGLLFTSFVYPTLVVQNMILFLSVAIVVLFVILLLWGFIFGTKEGFTIEPWMKWVLGIIIGIAFAIAVVWATGFGDRILSLFKQSWSKAFWTNFLFVIIIVITLVVILGRKKEGK